MIFSSTVNIMLSRSLQIFSIALLLSCPTSAAETLHVQTSKELIESVRKAKAGDKIQLAPGTYELAAPLEPKSGVSLIGAGMDKTIITHISTWKPSTKTLPDPEMKTQGLDDQAYLLRLQDKAEGITVSDLTLKAPQLHGAIYSWNSTNLHLHHLRIQDTLWTGIRSFAMKKARIHHCEFIDAGGRWKKGGIPGTDGGITGGAIFAVWMSDSEIAHCRFLRTQKDRQDEFYGIKGRQGKRCRIHHNTIEVNFSIEFPFENDEDMEIDSNICFGTISIPKYAGGPVPKSGRTFHIHHNWFRDTYSIEFVRNGVEIDHNLFDFDLNKDHGNLISGFGKAAASGPASFHNNLVSNPGRGVIWINEIYKDFDIHHNHIITRKTATPRKDGLFGFHKDCDFSTIRIRSNKIECIDEPRPLFRSAESYHAVVQNNAFTNISDLEKLTNKKSDDIIGLEKPLEFRCGVDNEYTIKGWEAELTRK